MPFDVDTFRAQFPIFGREIHGKPLVYLDSAASSQKPNAVIDVMTDVMRDGYANVHRGLHTLSNEATTAFEAARGAVARYLHAPSPDDVIFTMGGTDAVNLVANAIGQSIQPGDEIVLTVMEHHSNIVPWHFLRERYGAVLKWLDVDDDGLIDLEAYQDLLSERTRMVAVTGLSNVLGSAPPVVDMAELAHRVGAQILVDGCQHAVHGPVDVQALGVDYYVLTGHKIYGPTGIGVLWARPGLLNALPPYRGGGEMIDIVTTETITYHDAPHRFEAGTPPIVEAIGLGAALEFMMSQDIDGLRAHERAVTDYAMTALSASNHITVFGFAPDKGPVVAFNIHGAHPHDVSTIVDRQGVAVRAGHHCCQPLMQRLGVSATARASFGAYTTTEDVDALVAACAKAHDMLGG